LWTPYEAIHLQWRYHHHHHHHHQIHTGSPKLLLVTDKFVHSVECSSTAVLWMIEIHCFGFRIL
jgi:hypothetical protein